MALIEVSSSIQSVTPSEIFADGFELSQQSIIPSQNYSGSFTPGINNIEFYVYNAQNALQYSDYNFTDYQITDNNSISGSSADTTDVINLNPEKNVYDVGFSNGKLTAVYNFVNNELSSSISNPYYLAEISSDRTEIRLKSNFISNDEIQTSFIPFEETLKTAEFFDEFYISFGDNESHIGINTKLEIPEPDNTTRAEDQYSILIKLYDALPSKHKVNDQLYVYTKTGETQAYIIEFEEVINVPSDTISLKGPNTNLNIKDFINNSSTYKNKEELINTNSSASKDQLINVLEQKGIKLTPNYSTASFNEFVNFSSAKSRVNNFYLKVKNIQGYESDIKLLSSTTGSNAGAVSASIASLWTKIENEIKNFDGFEYYQYYNTGSDAYPKTGSTFPEQLLDYDDVKVFKWLGSDDPLNQYYGGTLLSASLYDDDNPNWLYYTIPTFITEQNDNDNYVDFCNMVGQSFDELWLYTKAVTEKLNTTNELDKGVPLSLADDVITSLGYTGFGNNYNNQDNFIGLIGNDNGDYLPPTGSELITQYIAINGGNIVNYWQDGYSFEDYVEQLVTNGFPYPIDKVSKEIFKRLYHNMAYLVKKKGTIAGLRQLINIWGVPSTILRINEFGGKNKDETDDYDLWYQRYSYAFTPVANSYRASASAVVPWMPLERNYIAESQYIVPDGIGFRFKTPGYPSSSYAGDFTSQSLAVKKSNGNNDDEFDWGIALFYTGSTSGSYSGSSNSDYRDWGEMRFFLSGSSADGGVMMSDPIYLPFFDGGWWSVLLQRDAHSNASNAITTYTLYAKNKIYDGWDGNSIGFEGSASISNYDTSSGCVYGNGTYGNGIYGGYISESANHGWNKFGTTIKDGVYIGGRLNGSRISNGFITNEAGFGFSGSFQEYRYYSNAITESVFNDFVMNPESIEGNKITGSQSSFDIVNFRAPLGNELENVFTASQLTNYREFISSSHPSVTASAPEYITSSFINPGDSSVTSSYYVRYEDNTIKRTYSQQNVETYFLDQPAIGLRNRISNKIQVQENLNFGTALSNVVSIQEDPFISQSYSENLNQLEVAFSPQDEVNDDIIQTLGFGAIQSAIADPRFRSQSALTYPELDKIADDYFRKYVGSDVFAYLRLIKYFDDSLFKAIKNYVPARTSVSTGIIIKQNMLERNRYREPQLNSFTTQSFGINNIPLPTQNLELTGSIETVNITGSAGGSINDYNVEASQSGVYSFRRIVGGSVPAGGYLQLNQVLSVTQLGTAENPIGDLYGEANSSFGSPIPSVGYLRSTKPVKAHLSVYVQTTNITGIDLIVSSSLRGELNRENFSNGAAGASLITPLLDILPEESIAFYVENTGNLISAVSLANSVVKTYDPDYAPSVTIQVPSSDISGSLTSLQAYIDNDVTSLGVVSTVKNYQDEFYDGEYSGSSLEVLVTQSNPFKSVPPSSTVVYPKNVFNLAATTQSANNTFSNITANSFDFNTTSPTINQDDLVLKRVTNTAILPFQKYQISYTTTVTTNPGVGNGVGLYGRNYNPESFAIYTPISENGRPQSAIKDITSNVSFSFTFIPPPEEYNNLEKRYSLGFQADAGIVGSVSQINIKGVGGEYEKVQANINWDEDILSSSFNILNTQSVVFESSDYNPINNNVNNNRKSSHHLLLSYNNVSPTPENIQNIIDATYNPLSQSVKASLPDSNYSALAALNPTYRGSTIQSLNYNFFTPSGSVRPLNSLLPPPYLKSLNGVSSSVANTFLDGTTGSWGGDLVDGRKSAAIDKYPKYIAHFNRSFEQLNLYNSREFTIDSLIEIPSTSIAGREITPNSVDIDGSNEHKKWVSSVFEPDRKIAVSFTPQNTKNTNVIDLETIQIGDYNLEGGSIQYLTLNTNAKSKNSSANAYFYTRGESTVSEIVFNGNLTGSTNGAVAGGGIIDSGSGYTQGTTSIIVGSLGTVSSLDGNGGAVFPIIEGGTVVRALFSASVVGGTIATNYVVGEEITIPQNVMTTRGYGGGGSSGDIRIVLEGANIQNIETLSIGQNQDAVQMVTASQVTGNGTQYGFLLSGSDTTGSEGNFLLPFAQDLRKSGFSGLPNEAKLAIGGPQLAVFHSYNQLVASQSVRGPLECPFQQDYRIFPWVLDGIDPSLSENYYQFSPSGSDCAFYEDNKSPFLIERGDILRVEGFKTLLSETITALTSSIAFEEEFLIEEIQNFYYSSSDASIAPPNGSFVQNVTPLTSNVVSSPTNDFPGYPLGNYFTPPSPVTAQQSAGDFTTSGTGTGAEIQITPTSGRTMGGGVTPYELYASDFIFGIGGAIGTGYAVGDTITISAAFINASFGTATQLNNIVITLDSTMLNLGGLANNFTTEVNLYPGCIGYELQYQTQARGLIGMALPTFIKTDRNPSEVLNGLNAGEITKFTIKRRVENEQKVMTKNNPSVRGSQGYLTQTGGGFLIPKDLSKVQSANALNIINQLRQKNAFPGDTATDREASNESVD